MAPRSRARTARTHADPGWRGLLIGLVAAAAVPVALLAAAHPVVASIGVAIGAAAPLVRALVPGVPGGGTLSADREAADGRPGGRPSGVARGE